MGNNLKFRPDGAAVGLLALLLAVVLAFSLLMPGRFFSGATFTSVAFQLPELGLADAGDVHPDPQRRPEPMHYRQRQPD